MTLWPLFLGLPIFIGVIIFLIIKIRKETKIYKQISNKLIILFKDYASSKNMQYSEKDTFGLGKKLKNNIVKAWKGSNYQQYGNISHIIYDNRGMYFFQSITYYSTSSGEENSVCVFENNIDHQDEIWIRSYNFSVTVSSDKQKKIIENVIKYTPNLATMGYGLFDQKEFNSNNSFFNTHKIFYTGNVNKVKMYITEKIFLLISEMENTLNLPISVEIRGKFVTIYTKGYNIDLQFEKGLMQPTGRLGEYGYLRRKEEIDMFIKFAKDINRYFYNY